MSFHGVRSTIVVALVALVGAGACAEDFGDTSTGEPGSRPPVENRAPVLSKKPSAVAAPYVPVTLDLLDGARDPDGDALSVTFAYQSDFSLSLLFADVDLQPDRRTVKVTPRGDAGTVYITYTVDDGNFHRVDGSATVTIGHAPMAFDASVVTTVNSPSQIVLQGSDPDGGAVTFAVASQPSFGALTGTRPNLTYTPATGYVGSDSFTFTVSDGQFTSTSARVSITVAALNHGPTADPQSVKTDQDTSITITLSGSDPDFDSLNFFVSALPAHGWLSSFGSNVFYTPSAGYHGPDSFTFFVSDGRTNSGTVTVSIDVLFVNHAPAAFDGSFSLNEDSSRIFSLSASDQDGDRLTYTIDPPKHGALAGAAPNLTYTPEANFSGTDSFTYVASDGTASSRRATVTLSVAAVNDAPTAIADTVTTAEDSSIAITLRGSDIDSSSLSFSIISFPLDGTLTGSGANRMYTPAPNVTGTRSFTFAVSDGSLTSFSATVTIAITPVNDPPQPSDDYVATNAGEALAINPLANDVDVDGDALALASVTQPAHGHADLLAGQVVYTPDADFAGVDAFDYTMADPAGLSASAHVRVGVGAGQFPVGAPLETLLNIAAATNDARNAPSLSSDGRYVAFTSALALVLDDTNGVSDVYVYDRGTRTVSRVSESSTGGQADGASRSAQISLDGRYIAFESIASNLVAGDTNATSDVFRHDRVTGETVRVSVSSSQSQGSGASVTPRISDDGNTLAFASIAFDLVDGDANGASDIFVRDMTAGTTTRVSVSAIGGDADLLSTEPALSGNGRFVAFTSAATNLVTGDGNALADVFVRDLVARTTTRVSVSSNTVEANKASSGASLSRDGRFVSFLTNATNLVTGASGTQVYVRDTRDLTTIRPLSETSASWARLSPDGRYLAVQGFSTAILCDRFAPATTTLGNWVFPSFSGSGRYLAAIGGSILVAMPNSL